MLSRMDVSTTWDRGDHLIGWNGGGGGVGGGG